MTVSVYVCCLTGKWSPLTPPQQQIAHTAWASHLLSDKSLLSALIVYQCPQLPSLPLSQLCFFSPHLFLTFPCSRSLIQHCIRGYRVHSAPQPRGIFFFSFLFSSHFPTFLSFSSFLHSPPFPLSHYDTGTCRTGCNVSPCKHTLSIHFTSTSFSFSHLVIFLSAHIFSLRCHLIETPEVCLSACIKWILCHRVQILNINNIPLCVAWVSEHWLHFLMNLILIWGFADQITQPRCLNNMLLLSANLEIYSDLYIHTI